MEDGERNGMHYHQSIERTFKELDAEACITKSVKIAKSLMDATPVSTGNYDIIFATDMLGDLISAFELVFSAKAAKEGVNPWRKKIGDQVADKGITIIDMPKYENGFNYRTFDAEGFLCNDTTLIENGELKTFYHNSATANHFGVSNNANASRSPKGVLGVGGSQKVIQPGKSQNSSLRDGKFLEIFALQGLHSGADPISGDFSFGASGFLHEDGEVVQTIKGITVSGNFFKFINQIGDIGSELKPNQEKNFFSPEIRFTDVNIAGK
jgi:PmbA protein